MQYDVQHFTDDKQAKQLAQGHKDSEQRCLNLNSGSLLPKSGITAIVTEGFSGARWALSKSAELFGVIQNKPGYIRVTSQFLATEQCQTTPCVLDLGTAE